MVWAAVTGSGMAEEDPFAVDTVAAPSPELVMVAVSVGVVV